MYNDNCLLESGLTLCLPMVSHAEWLDSQERACLMWFSVTRFQGFSPTATVVIMNSSLTKFLSISSHLVFLALNAPSWSQTLGLRSATLLCLSSRPACSAIMLLRPQTAVLRAAFKCALSWTRWSVSWATTAQPAESGSPDTNQMHSESCSYYVYSQWVWTMMIRCNVKFSIGTYYRSLRLIY